MNEIEYIMFEESSTNEDSSKYTSYGIEVKKGDKTEAHVSDVFLSKQEAKTFINLCNEENLDPIHLMDVIYDKLSAL